MSTLYDVSIQFKDSPAIIYDYLISSTDGADDLPEGYRDDDIFYYGLDENNIVGAVKSGEFIDNEFKITSYNGVVARSGPLSGTQDLSTSGLGSVNGYEIQRLATFIDRRGFAFAFDKSAPSTFVTWQFTENLDFSRDFYWGHYFSSRERALEDFGSRIDDYLSEYDIGSPIRNNISKEILTPSLPLHDGVPFHFITIVEGYDTIPDIGVYDTSEAVGIFDKIIKDPGLYSYDPRFDKVVLGFIGNGHPFTPLAESLCGNKTVHDRIGLIYGKSASESRSISSCIEKLYCYIRQETIIHSPASTNLSGKDLYGQQIENDKQAGGPSRSIPGKPNLSRSSR